MRDEEEIASFRSLFIPHPSALIPSLLSSDSRQLVRVQFKGGHLFVFARQTLRPHLFLRVEDALVIVRDNAHKLWQPFVPGEQDFSCAATIRVLSMTKDHVFQCFYLFRV